MLECLVPIYAYSYIMILCRIFSPRHSFPWPLYLSCDNDFYSFLSHVYDSYILFSLMQLECQVKFPQQLN
jgi:hypothetical protein